MSAPQVHQPSFPAPWREPQAGPAPSRPRSGPAKPRLPLYWLPWFARLRRARRIEKGLWLVDSEIVDENVDLGELRDESGTAFGATKIEDGRMRSGARRCLLDLGDRVSNRSRSPPIDDNFSAHLREPGGGSQSNASGRAGDKRNLSSQIEIHMLIP